MIKSYLRKSSLLLVVGLCLAGCKEDLYTKLSEREANEMLAVLLRNGVEASRTSSKDGLSVLHVDDSQKSIAIEILKGKGYPRQTYANFGEVFKGNGFVASPTEERARFMFALSEELSKTISTIDGVVSARVHMVMPKNDPFRLEKAAPSASVFIRYDSSMSMTALVPQIKTMIANSVEGVAYDKVSVVMSPVDMNTLDVSLAREAISEKKFEFFEYIAVFVAFLFAAFVLLRNQLKKFSPLRLFRRENDAFASLGLGNIRPASQNAEGKV